MTSAEDWAPRRAPDLDAFDAIAADALISLPEAFRRMCGNVAIHVAEMAEDDVLDDLGIEDGLELTGLYEGVNVLERSESDPAPLGAHVHLFRLPILFEWCERGDVTLSELIRHVLVHEIGHHFGLSDEDMHAIEETADED